MGKPFELRPVCTIYTVDWVTYCTVRINNRVLKTAFMTLNSAMKKKHEIQELSRVNGHISLNKGFESN